MELEEFLEHYRVEEDGSVFSIRSNKYLEPANNKGYHRICVSINNKRKHFAIHRLVALMYVDGDKSLTVNHIDGNKLNNHISNLEWNTTQENLEHKRINNLGKTLKAKLSATGINNSQAKLDEEDVIFIRTNCETIIDIKKFSKELNVSIATIYDIKNRRSWTHI